jgi:hypothetical protein
MFEKKHITHKVTAGDNSRNDYDHVYDQAFSLSWRASNTLSGKLQDNLRKAEDALLRIADERNERACLRARREANK